MNLDDLRYSNTLYTFRATWEKPKTVDEIASELKMTPLTVSKIINKLCNDKLVEKYKKTTNNIDIAIKIKCFVPNNEYIKTPLNEFTKFYHIILKVAKDWRYFIKYGIE